MKKVLLSRRVKADLALLFVTFIWGTTFAIMKGVFEIVTPFYFLSLRFGFATLVLVVVFHKRLYKLDWPTVKSGIVAGILLFGGYSLQVVGLELTTASKASFITGLCVVLVPCFAALFFNRKPTIMTWIGVVLALLGLNLLTFNGEYTFNLGDVLVFFCAIFLALHILFVDRYVKDKDSILLAILQIATVALLSLISSFLEGSCQIVKSFSVWSSVIYMGALATGLAFIIQNKAQKFTTPTRTGVVFSMEPVFGVFFAYLYLGEVISNRGYLGGILIVAGMLLAEVDFNNFNFLKKTDHKLTNSN